MTEEQTKYIESVRQTQEECKKNAKYAIILYFIIVLSPLIINLASASAILWINIQGYKDAEPNILLIINMLTTGVELIAKRVPVIQKHISNKKAIKDLRKLMNDYKYRQGDFKSKTNRKDVNEEKIFSLFYEKAESIIYNLDQEMIDYFKKQQYEN